MQHHDHGYKSLFSHPEMVKDLLTGFVIESWVNDLDFSTLTKVNTHFIADEIRERMDDVVWRIKFRDRWLYIYILLEFQSRPDRWMAVRLLSYTGLLYQDLIKSKQLDLNSSQPLPAVLPLVLYNGSAPWRSALSLSDLLQDLPEQLRAYQPQLHYVLIDEKKYSDSRLESVNNLVSALFKIEKSNSPQQISGVLKDLINWLKDPEQSTLHKAFAEWLNLRWLNTGVENPVCKPLNDLMEWNSMLAENIETWTAQWKREARKEGLREGRVEGRVEGRDERAIETAIVMKKEGESMDKIIKYTQLSKEVIEQL